MNSPRKILAGILISVFCLCFIECPKLFGQYRFDTWTTDNGLPQNGLREITQTPDGYLWFTTFDGLVRFDGVRFTAFNKNNTEGIINNRFTGLYSDKDGTLYATTMEDGVLTIGRNGVFSSYTSDQVPGHYIKLIKPDDHGDLRFLVEDDERKSETWYYLIDGKFVAGETQNKTSAKLEFKGQSGAMWTITATETTELRNGITTIYPLEILKIDGTLPVFEDNENRLWIGGINLSLLGNGKIEKFGKKDGFLTNAEFQSFRQETDGSIWFAHGGRMSEGLGLVRYQAGAFTSFGRESGLMATGVFDVFNDREGTTWLGTNKGLNRLQKKIVSGYSTKDGINYSEVYPLYRDSRENIWIGTTKGLSIYRNGKFEPLDLKQSPRQQISAEDVWLNGKMSVQSLWEDASGKMWIGLNGGLFTARNGVAERIRIADGHHVLAIKADRSGNVWAATNKGLLQFKDYKFVRSYTTKDGLPNDFMTVIFEDSKGGFWFGGYGGLSEFKAGKFINYTTAEGLTGNYVRTIYEDNEGVFWIGTYDEGLSRFKDGKFVNYKEENGLYNSGVFAIQADSRNNFWISSNRGLYRVKRQELNDFADGKIVKINSVGYGKADGMLSTECNGGRQPATLTDKDGKFWFPTQEGVIVVDAEAEIFNSVPPPVVIEEVTVEREPVNFRNGITIEAGRKNLEIRYTGLSLIKSEQIKFQYKLEGHDADWIDAEHRRTAYYSSLPPGNYTFRVRAANSDGVWNEEGATVSVDLKPFFYQTAGFYLLIIFGAACGLLVIWKTSVYQLELREKRLMKLVAERTSELAEANRILHRQANSDGLTKIGNRRRFEQFLADEWNRAVRFKTEISLIMVDIDHFKLFNDTYGHQAGDDCLQKVAEALASVINRPTDLVARFGGEEFAVILGGTDSKGAATIAEQAMENIKKLQIPHSKSETNEYLTISIGVVTTFATFELTEADLVNAADKSLYQAKKGGRNRIISYDFLTRATRNNSVLEKEFVCVN